MYGLVHVHFGSSLLVTNAAFQGATTSFERVGRGYHGKDAGREGLAALGSVALLLCQNSLDEGTLLVGAIVALSFGEILLDSSRWCFFQDQYLVWEERIDWVLSDATK